MFFFVVVKVQVVRLWWHRNQVISLSFLEKRSLSCVLPVPAPIILVFPNMKSTGISLKKEIFHTFSYILPPLCTLGHQPGSVRLDQGMISLWRLMGWRKMMQEIITAPVIMASPSHSDTELYKNLLPFFCFHLTRLDITRDSSSHSIQHKPGSKLFYNTW